MTRRPTTLQDLVGAIYESAIHAAGWPETVKIISEVFRAPTAGLVVADPKTGERDIYALQGYSEAWAVKVWWARYAWANDGYRFLAARPPGTPFISSLHMPASWMESEFYVDCLKLENIRYYGAMHIQHTPSTYGLVIVCRDRNRKDYTASDARMLAWLHPHLKRAHRVTRDLATSRMRRDTFLEALYRAPMPSILVDEAGAVLMCNAAAERVLAARGITIQGSRLQTGSPSTQASLDQVIQRACATTLYSSLAGGGEVRIPGAPHGIPLVVSVTPLPLQRAVWVGGRRATALVLLLDPDLSNPTSTQTLSDLYGLTVAEARTAQAVADGLSPSDIADRFRLGRETVRTQLAAVFRKTDTRRQAELVRLLLRLAPDSERPGAALPLPSNEYPHAGRVAPQSGGRSEYQAMAD